MIALNGVHGTDDALTDTVRCDSPWNEDAPDCILQVQTSSLVHRLMLFHRDEELRRRVYINGGCEEVIELPHCPEVHPSLDRFLLFKNLSVPSLEFKQFLDSSFIKQSISRAFFLGKLQATSDEDLIHQIKVLSNKKHLPGRLRIMAFPRTLQNYMTEELQYDFDLHPVDYDFTLFALALSSSCIRYAIRPASETFLTSPDGPPRVPGQLCRAAGKILEALEVAGFTPGTGIAIDVGASPGGWTAQLATNMGLVIAIDPAELAPEVLSLPNVVYIKKKSQDATEDVHLAIEQHNRENNDNNENNRVVDLLTCDANKHPIEMLPVLEPLMALLRPGGLIVLTLKFRGKGKFKEYGRELVQNQLGDDFKDVRVLWLTANTANERTVVAVKR